MPLAISATSHSPARSSTAAPIPSPQLESRSLAARLRQTWASVAMHGAAVHRDARFAGPHRARLWDAARALVAARPTGEDARKLQPALAALKAFVREFEPFAESGDEQLQSRIFAGSSKERPGLTGLLNDVLAAGGMGRVQRYADVVDR